MGTNGYKIDHYLVIENMYKSFNKLLICLILALSVVGCQDDPVLEEVVDGVPVVTPKSKAYIKTIQVNTYPATDPNGDPWDMIDSTMLDTLGLPDIFFNITIPEPQPPVLWSQNSHFSNVAANDTTPFVLLDEYEVVPFDSYIDINIYDFETPDSTLMGTVNFFIGKYPDPTNPYPDAVTSNMNGYSVTIAIRWEE